ncbi:MAG: peptide chain release factor N(5)-glutamine methyltransferase [Lachnospiraceae bacterium]|nr:peptide chain release factor N(5)-glutamine methyltransferase [Lachnospiraceae bacterium]
MTYRDARVRAAGRLREAGIENERPESEFLLEFACGLSLNDYLLHQGDEMPPEQERIFRELIEKRCRRIPLQHLTGEQEFMGLPFYVNEHVLIPRQDTELLVEEAICLIENGQNTASVYGKDLRLYAENSSETGIAPENCRQDCTGAENGAGTENSTGTEDSRETRGVRVLDLCTGSGCIAVSLKKFCPDVTVTGSDISAEALRVAVKNAARSGADVRFVQSDLFSDLTGQFHLILSNPPYIPTDVIPTLMPEVRDHEPCLALDGSPDGLFFYRKIIEDADRYLFPGGCLLFEIGYDQGEAVSELMRDAGYTEIEVVQDLQGLDRVVKGRRIEHV